MEFFIFIFFKSQMLMGAAAQRGAGCTESDAFEQIWSSVVWMVKVN